MLTRIGHGYDVHKLVTKAEFLEIYPERISHSLKLAGVEIVVANFDKVLLGHSDADVIIHALCDALLGAAAQRDIGFHFPDSDMTYSGIASLVLLDKVHDILQAEKFAIANIDITVLAQEPKLGPYIPKMIANLAQALDLEESQVNIKATTTERLGFTGRGEGIAAEAVCLLDLSRNVQ